MNKKDFMKALGEKVSVILGDSGIVGESLVPVNNDRPTEALAIRSKGSPFGIYINIGPHYEAFCAGVELEWIAEYICRKYNRQVADTRGLADNIIHFLSDFRVIRDKIVFRLVNADMNEESLKSVPHIRILDLAMVFGISMGNSRDGFAWAGITYDKMRRWGIGEGDLLKAALKNTPSICPVTMDDMYSIFLKMVKECALDGKKATQQLEAMQPKMKKMPMYSLSNSLGLHGAGVFLYPGILRSLADSIGKNLVILPSSIHEVILVPENEKADMEAMKDMVMDINRNGVAKEDWLADNAYLYNREHDCIKAAGRGGLGETEVFDLSELECIAREETFDEAV